MVTESPSDRGGNGGDRCGGIMGDRLVSERSNDQKDEMVAVVNRQRVEGNNSQLGKRGVNQISGIGDSRREIVVNAVRKDGVGWEAIVGTGTTPHGDPVVQRRRLCGEGCDVQEVTRLVPKYDDDNFIFIGGQVDNIGRTVYAQVDGGSDVSCVLKEHVVALGLDGLMVPRDITRQVKVR